MQSEWGERWIEHWRLPNAESPVPYQKPDQSTREIGTDYKKEEEKRFLMREQESSLQFQLSRHVHVSNADAFFSRRTSHAIVASPCHDLASPSTDAGSPSATCRW